MTDQALAPTPPLLRRVRLSAAQMDPVARNGYALVLTTIITSLTGVLYWMVAAHLFSPAEVGRSAGALTAMTLIGTVATMNMTGSLSYLLPQLGRGATKWVGATYGAAAIFALGLGAAFLVFVHSVHTSLSFLTDNLWIATLFLVAAPIAAIFSLQDGVLIGLRRSPWVLAENALFGVCKLLILVVVGELATRNGVFLSWLAPMFLAVPIVNGFILRRLLPATRQMPNTVPMAARHLRRFLGLTYAGGLLNQAYFSVLPLLVLAILGSSANAAFYVAWTIAITVDLVSHGMGTSLTVEASADPEKLPQHARDVIRRLGLLLLPSSVLAIVVAPQFLQLYGGSYASNATVLFRLLMLAVLPRALVIIAQSAARARGQAWITVWTEAATALLVLGLAIPFLHRYGISAVGWAWLAANVIVAVAVLPALLKCLGHGRSTTDSVEVFA